ncbi:MAG: hypothetical protein HON65_03360 [Rhodospirillales bacterium]|nr:hypothetical protein [Rhodospirillales bacterium]
MKTLNPISLFQGMFMKSNTIISTLIVVLISVLFFQIQDYAIAQSTQLNQGTSSTTKLYTHPKKGFSLNVPTDAVLTEREAPVDISLNSRLGWGMTVQSATANPSSPLEELVTKLEMRYLGQDKPWSQKLKGTKRMFKEYEAYDATYEGSGMRARVIIIRATQQDYVLMFVTPSDLYASVSASFENILSSFQPTPVEGHTLTQNQQAAVSQPTQSEIEYVRFSEVSFGYSILYPATWRIGKADDFTVVFTGPSQNETPALAITIQNVTSPIVAQPQHMAKAVMQQLKTQMAYGVPDVRHVGGGDIIIAGIECIQLISDFNRLSFPYRQWSIIIPRPTGNIVHVWTYSAPLDRFNDNQAIIETMINSWRFEHAAQ